MPGHRRLRRWQNQFFLGQNLYRHKTIHSFEDSEDEAEAKGIQWKSLFQELMQDQEKLNAFLGCENEQPRVHWRRPKDQSEMEYRFSLISSKAKSALHNFLRVRGMFVEFLQDLEEFLCECAVSGQDGTIPAPVPTPGDYLVGALDQSFVIHRKNTKPNSQGQRKSRIDRVSLCLTNSAHRIILHGCCEFHGFSSSSHTDEGKRWTDVKFPQNRVQANTERFALEEKEDKKEEKEVTSENCSEIEPRLYLYFIRPDALPECPTGHDSDPEKKLDSDFVFVQSTNFSS